LTKVFNVPSEKILSMTMMISCEFPFWRHRDDNFQNGKLV